MGSSWSRRAWTVLTAGLLASVAACGGAGPSGSGSSNSVTIGKAVDTVGFTAVDIAVERGFFKEQGIEPKVVLLGGSAVANSALQSGSIQFSAAATQPLLEAREKGLPFVSIASMDYGIPLQLVVNRAQAAKSNLAQRQGTEERIRSLAGSTIGIVSETDNGFVKLLLGRAGMPQDAVKTVRFQSAAAAVTAVEQGQVDGTLGSPPNSLAAVARGNAETVINARDFQEYRDMTYDILTTTESYAAKNEDTVRRVATAIAKADNWIRANPDQALAIEQKHFPQYPPEVLKQSLALVAFSRDGQQTPDQWANTVRTYVDAGLLKPTEAPEGKVWTNKYVDRNALNP